MREEFHGQLERLGDELIGMCELAAEAMRGATRALLEADLELAERVMADDVELDEAGERCEEHASTLLALQAPVATELRIVLATIYCAVKVERMGDLAAHVAEIARRAHPAPAVPPELLDQVREMAWLDIDMAARLAALVSGESAEGGFGELRRTDDVVDALHAELLDAATGSEWTHGVAAAINLALLARFYERYADQAVSVARRLEFAVTGTLPG
ncbi:phosphate signaling complex protein PhoU [Saccharopolyspora erythraea]|uniref:phosphate signaling complex protein PhoU n=1 Tax=Saccharopolyspora erythraea TaxID=1836 RepID=UPI001BA66980|nr:phosphate signaling complex protein PhoU [Saccharopolyspora erythraea]QUH00646.1 phosphate signaling complex protein PhoU [Saccharopolyspora erythraea]